MVTLRLRIWYRFLCQLLIGRNALRMCRHLTTYLKHIIWWLFVCELLPLDFEHRDVWVFSNIRNNRKALIYTKVRNIIISLLFRLQVTHATRFCEDVDHTTRSRQMIWLASASWETYIRSSHRRSIIRVSFMCLSEKRIACLIFIYTFGGGENSRMRASWNRSESQYYYSRELLHAFDAFFGGCKHTQD